MERESRDDEVCEVGGGGERRDDDRGKTRDVRGEEKAREAAVQQNRRWMAKSVRSEMSQRGNERREGDRADRGDGRVNKSRSKPSIHVRRIAR